MSACENTDNTWTVGKIFTQFTKEPHKKMLSQLTCWEKGSRKAKEKLLLYMKKV